VPRVQFKSGKGGAVTILASIDDEFSLHRISLDVVLVIQEILGVANTMIGETALPDFAFPAEDFSEGVGVAALDKLDGVLDSYIMGRSQQKMNMLGHEDEGVELIAAAITVESFQEEADVIFDDEESSTLPSRESDEIGSGRGDESSRLQEQTSAAKAAIFA
jgi:hypothetical protein